VETEWEVAPVNGGVLEKPAELKNFVQRDQKDPLQTSMAKRREGKNVDL